MKKILYADDEPEVRDIIKKILTKENYEVILAADGNETLKLAKGKKPDLIILDYLMPGLNGIEILEALQKGSETKPITVIMVTAYSYEKEKSLDADAVDFLTKPIEKADLFLRIKSVLKVSHIKNELQRIITYIAELEKE